MLLLLVPCEVSALQLGAVGALLVRSAARSKRSADAACAVMLVHAAVQSSGMRACVVYIALSSAAASAVQCVYVNTLV